MDFDVSRAALREFAKMRDASKHLSVDVGVEVSYLLGQFMDYETVTLNSGIVVSVASDDHVIVLDDVTNSLYRVSKPRITVTPNN